MQESPVPDPSRSHDVSGLTDAELARTRRDLQASLALARPGSAAECAHLGPPERDRRRTSGAFGRLRREREAAQPWHPDIGWHI